MSKRKGKAVFSSDSDDSDSFDGSEKVKNFILIENKT